MRGRRNLIILLLVAVLLSAVSFTPWGTALDRLSLDFLHLIDFKLRGQAPMSDEVAIIAIDEETYRDEHFRNLPQALWTPELGPVLDAVLAAKPKAVGVDIIIGTTADSIAPGYDRPWLMALKRGAEENRIVLGFSQNQAEPILPTIQQRKAVKDFYNTYLNQAPANTVTDPDGVVRRMPVVLPSRDGPLPVLSAALYQRATGITTEELAGRGELILNFAAAQRPVLYSLADLRACVEAGRADFLAKAFAAKIVLIGGILDVEDRKLTSSRFATSPEGSGYGPRCATSGDVGKYFSGFSRDLIPGVLVHAAAVDNLLHGNSLREPGMATRAIVIFIAALASVVMFVRARVRLALPLWLALLAVWIATSLLAFHANIAAPLITGLAAMSLAAPAGIALRLGSMDRSRRQLRNAFSLYLPKSEVDRLVKEEKLPALGGELRDVTILFSDIASYSTLSERVEPGPLVDELNRYFGRMTDIVQAHGGFVDKFIGDGVLAIFGAPLIRENAAADAVLASLAMIRSLQQEPLFIGGDGRIAIRIGLHRGEAIVGNIGSAQRFNYTVMGDAVNVASRLEGVGKHYGIPIVVSEQVQELAAKTGRIAFRELDFIRVVGRDQPVRLFQPLELDVAASLDLAAFDAALHLWRKGAFAEAGKAFAVLAAQGDTLAARYVAWAQTYAETPMSNWEGIIQQGSK